MIDIFGSTNSPKYCQFRVKSNKKQEVIKCYCQKKKRLNRLNISSLKSSLIPPDCPLFIEPNIQTFISALMMLRYEYRYFVNN